MHTTIHTRRQARTTCALFAATTIAAAAPALAQAMHAPGDSTSQTPHEQPLSSEPAAGVAKADTLSHGTTAQERKALLIRSEALNRRYHLGAYSRDGADARGEALNARYGNAWTHMSPQAFKTLITLFGGNVTRFSLRDLQAYVAHGPAAHTNANIAAARAPAGFAWGDAGIGALTALAGLLVAAAGIVARRRIRPTIATPTPTQA